jgi:hypothetical protein
MVRVLNSSISASHRQREAMASLKLSSRTAFMRARGRAVHPCHSRSMLETFSRDDSTNATDFVEFQRALHSCVRRTTHHTRVEREATHRARLFTARGVEASSRETRKRIASDLSTTLRDERNQKEFATRLSPRQCSTIYPQETRHLCQTRLQTSQTAFIPTVPRIDLQIVSRAWLRQLGSALHCEPLAGTRAPRSPMYAGGPRSD